MDYSREIIFYQYNFSAYSQRVLWYLNLRRIPYKQCLQPPMMPRPDVSLLGVSYRRIPLLTIGRDIYLDTRLILSKLEALFPPSSSHPPLSSPSSKATEKLLEHWVMDHGIFSHAPSMFPSDLPVFKDEKFVKDREQYLGRTWSKESADKERPEALVEMKGAFMFLENTVLGDGREWILGEGKKGPSLADIEAVWAFHFFKRLEVAFPTSYISASHFPKTFAWMERFDAAALSAIRSHGESETVSGPEAVKRIESEGFAEEEASVDEGDPSGLRKGEMVEVWPIDSGSSHKERGALVGLSTGEVVVQGRMEGGKEVRVHCPRHGFRVIGVEGGGKL